MKTVLTFLFTAIVFISFAQPPSVPADPGATFGEQITKEQTQPATALPGLLKDQETIETKIEGKVIDVCPKKGCWIKLEITPQQHAFVRMKDYGFFVPTALKGHTVIIEGTAKTVVTSVEDLKHYAEDAKKSQAEIDAIKDPKSEIQLMANGILVVK